MELKRCSSCKKDKPISEFPPNKSRRDGLNHMCKPCWDNYCKDYYSKNREKSLEKSAEYYGAHREDIIEKQRVYREENRDEIRERSKSYSIDPESVRENQKKYHSTPKGKACLARAKHKRRLFEKQSIVDLTGEEWSLVLDLQNHTCLSCGREFNEALPPTIDHVIPLSNGGNLTFSNVQALCRPCNTSKGVKTIDYRTW